MTSASNSVQKDSLYNQVKISTANGIQVLDGSSNERVKIGNISSGIYGMQLKRSDGTVVLQQDSNGDILMAGKLGKIGDATTYVQFSGTYGDLTSYFNGSQFFKLENTFGGLAFIHENKEHFSVGASGFIFGKSSQHTTVDFSFVDSIVGFYVKFA